MGLIPKTDDEFRAAVAHLTEEVDRELTRLLHTEEPVANLHDGVLYSLGLDTRDKTIRGKRLRPVLGLLTAEALGADRHLALPFAAAIEILHNFALVHDDIEDGDEVRRGRPATWKRFGTAHGINIGDYMLAKVFRIVQQDRAVPDHVRIALIDLLGDTLEELFAGQALDISARSLTDFSFSHYELLVAKKTGSYLAAPMLGGAIVANAPDEVLMSLRAFGASMGPMFQIKDDLIDLTVGKGRGVVGNDIREGKRSFLVAAVSERCTPAERIRLFEILNTPREATNPDHVEEAIELFRRYGVMKLAEDRCQELQQSGISVIAGLPKKLRGVLELAAANLATRTA